MADLSPSSDDKDVILVLGASQATRQRLLEDALGSKLSFSPHKSDTLIQSPFKIVTKYYTAPLQLCMLPESSDSPSFTTAHSDLHSSVSIFLEGSVDAVIALHTNAESKEDTQRYIDYLSQATDSFDPGVMLYIVEDESTITPSLIEWCHENGFEVVSLKSEEEVEDDEDERFKEKTGAARILEALESHMWTNMEYKTDLRPQKEKKAKVEDEEQALDLDDESDLLEDMPEEIKATFGNLLSFMNIKPDSASIESKDDGMSLDTDNLDMPDLLSSLRNQLSTLDDEKRRAMAAKVAMMMMGSLGDDDDDDDLF